MNTPSPDVKLKCSTNRDCWKTDFDVSDRTVVTVLLQYYFYVLTSHSSLPAKTFLFHLMFTHLNRTYVWNHVVSMYSIHFFQNNQKLAFTSSHSLAESVSHMSDMLSYLLRSILSSKLGFVLEECTGWSEKCLLISCALLETLFQQKYVMSS